MADMLRLDSHKLMFHPHVVSRWLAGEVINPLYVEISPSGACNHRCRFCALDFMGYESRFLDSSLLCDRISELGRLGVKSILFGGEGEPLLHPELATIIAHTKTCGIDAALTTNGVLLTEDVAALIVPSLSWIKVSLNAGAAATYAALHGTSEDDFEDVLANITSTAAVIAAGDSGCTLGVQAILLPENAAELETLAARVKADGASYFVIKSYSQHGSSTTREYAGLDYEQLFRTVEPLERMSSAGFSVIVRGHSMHKLVQRQRGYGRCLALPFWSYIDAGGNVWGCSAFLGDERFWYGSINEESFEQIWHGERRKHSLELVSRQLDPAECRQNCRMDEVNRYLWELTHPNPHVNFI